MIYEHEKSIYVGSFTSALTLKTDLCSEFLNMEVNIGKLKIAYKCAEPVNAVCDEKKSPIVTFHGATASKEYWDDVLLPLAEGTGRKVYAYDARNHGDSDWFGNMNYENQIDDLLQFMNCLHMEQAVLVGHSMGARTAMLFALKWPDRVEQLIIEDTSPLEPNDRVRNQVIVYLEIVKTAINKIPGDVKNVEEAKNFVNDFLMGNMPKDLKSSRFKREFFLTLTQDENGAYKWKCNLDLFNETTMKQEADSSLIKGKYMGPALMLHGTRSSHEVLKDQEIIIKLFPRIKFIPIEGATHQIHWYCLDLFLKEVIPFINNASRKNM